MPSLPSNFLPAWRQAELIRRREVSAGELMEETLRRIEALNPKLNAFVAMLPPEKLIAEARAVSDRLSRGEEPGPLAGLPLGVKDLEDAVGLPNTHGSLLYKDNMAQRDTIQVERLKRAGAIVIGKTNTPEFGYTCLTKNRVYGVTRNPWNLARTPGGSSGGASAAVSSGMVALATASDGGGSVRIPASFTGLFGMKPSQGRIPWGPEDMPRFSACIVSGPLTRCVRDAALWLDVTVGPHELDPCSLPHPGYSYVEVMERAPKKLRIAYSPTLGFACVAREVKREVEAALAALEACGHSVELIDHGIDDIVLYWAGLLSNEESSIHHRQMDGRLDLLDPEYRMGLELVPPLSPALLGDIQRCRGELFVFMQRVFERFDLLATPTVASPPFDAEGPLPFTVDGAPVTSPGAAIAFTYPFNFSAHPAVSVRAGFTDDGLPVGLQLVSPRLREDLLLQVSRQYEQARPWEDRWPEI